MDRTEIQTEPQIETQHPEASANLLDGWMSRAELAAELGFCVDTLMRWERRRYGPKCVKAGRKALYKRSTVLAWLEAQESAVPEIETPHSRGRSPKRPLSSRIGGRKA